VADRLAEVDACAGTVFDAARDIGAQIVVVSEYGLTPVRRPVLPNRVLREAGWLAVRPGPFGEMLDTFNSRAFAVVDHQVAHVYVAEPALVPQVAERLRETPGVDQVLDRKGQQALGLDHPHSGELVALSDRDAWFAYAYWQDDRGAPDFARTVDIHRKPGYDPCELFVDPAIRWPKLRMGRRLLQKLLGFRYLMDLIPLDPGLIRGSHGLHAADPLDGPVIITSLPHGSALPAQMTELKPWLLQLLGLNAHEAGR
jgi:predicted AlkP superfamily pyrophosphatase or phosphodiesterase